MTLILIRQKIIIGLYIKSFYKGGMSIQNKAKKKISGFYKLIV